MRSWDALPERMRIAAVRPSYDALRAKPLTRACKRLFDLALVFFLLPPLLPLIVWIALGIKWSDKGPVLFSQERITRYGERFRIYKFRSMVLDAETILPTGTGVKDKDPRLFPFGAFLRRLRLDEIPQLYNVLRGEMSFVGPRPILPESLQDYQGEDWAALLMPAGITSMASIYFKDEAELLKDVDDEAAYYRDVINPKKFALGCRYVNELSFWKDLKIMGQTLLAVLKG